MSETSAVSHQNHTELPIPPPLPGPLSDSNNAKQNDENANVDTNVAMEAINLSWCFGYNKQKGILNLCLNESRKMFLASSHVGVVYDFDANTQKLLQGHRNSISCFAVSEDKRWLITADSGADSTIIVWDLNSNVPVQTYFDTHLDGTISVAITPDSKYIASLSADYPQVLAVWEWTTDADTPVCTAELDPRFGPQLNIRFNSDDTSQIVTNSNFQCVFYEWSHAKGFTYFAPVLNDASFNKPVGSLSQSVFQVRSDRALTGTSLGNLVVWKTRDGSDANISDKKAYKLFKLQNSSINVLTLMNDIIVIGDSDGHVRFIDQHLHILMWYKHFKLGPIQSLSFSTTTKDYAQSYSLEPIESDATIEYKKFLCKDFLVNTKTSLLGYVTKSGTDIRIVNQSTDGEVHGVACHPHLPRVCFGDYKGILQLWDYEKKSIICSRHFQKGYQVHSLRFDPQGNHIVVGFRNGHLQIVDAISLDDCLLHPFTYSKEAITHIEFAHDSSFMATAEADFTVSVYKYNFMSGLRDEKNGQEKIATELYTFLGRYRSHYKEIVSLMFGLHPGTTQIRLLSLGKDRLLCEYDLEKSNYDELIIKEKIRIEQYGVPLAMLWHPPISRESFILTINDQWKYKLYNSITKMCRKTLLGPTFGSHIKKMIQIPTSGDDSSSASTNRYMAYITQDKVGLQKYPLTGNPFDSVALFAHPDGVSNVCTSFCGSYLFTSGADNANVFMWRLNTKALQAQSVLGGADLTPFYGLLDGGRDGEFFKEMRELFYYSQLRHHGLHENTDRVIKTTIPLSEIPFVMRGLGFYPTEQEIEEMINEVKFEKYIDTNELVEAIDLDDFIRLYINHRPAFGIDPAQIYDAFRVLNINYERNGGDDNEGGGLPRHIFLNELQARGEHMTDYELADCVSHLLHTNHQVDELSHEQIANLIDKYLPEHLTVDKFMTDLIGVDTREFEDILEAWENIRKVNTPRLNQSKQMFAKQKGSTSTAASSRNS